MTFIANSDMFVPVCNWSMSRYPFFIETSEDFIRLLLNIAPYAWAPDSLFYFILYRCLALRSKELAPIVMLGPGVTSCATKSVGAKTNRIGSLLYFVVPRTREFPPYAYSTEWHRAPMSCQDPSGERPTPRGGKKRTENGRKTKKRNYLLPTYRPYRLVATTNDFHSRRAFSNYCDILETRFRRNQS